jgi:PAS domain S-box-containing protein
MDGGRRAGVGTRVGAAIRRFVGGGALATQATLPQLARPLQVARTAIQHYGVAVVAVAAALMLALFLHRYHIERLEFPIFLFEIALVVWYLGVGPAILAVALSSLSFNYYFTEPAYTFYVNANDLAYYIVFVLFAILLTWFSAIRRRFERELLRSRDDLKKEVALRTQQASLLDLTHDTIFVRDMNDIITYWNRGAQELFGWTPEEAIGKPSHELLQTGFPIPVADIRAELLRTSRWEGELQKTKADGSRVMVASRWSLRRDGLGRPLAILETNNDVTDRKRREEEIRNLNQELGKRSSELEASNKELEAFAYSISHDLRAPLRHMVGFTELLQKHLASALDEKGRRYVTTILDSTKRMGTLIDDLLAFSRIARAETRETTVSLAQLVKEVRDEMQPETSGRDIAWRVGELPELRGDRSMLRLALVNLISNAVKFTRKRPRAEIEIGCLKQKNDGVTVFIKDNGVGFDMKYVNKLFGVFQRLHRAEAFEGTGIGLATVQRIVHRHGGKVWAEALVDAGATFFIEMPGPGFTAGLGQKRSSDAALESPPVAGAGGGR